MRYALLEERSPWASSTAERMYELAAVVASFLRRLVVGVRTGQELTAVLHCLPVTRLAVGRVTGRPCTPPGSSVGFITPLYNPKGAANPWVRRAFLAFLLHELSLHDFLQLLPIVVQTRGHIAGTSPPSLPRCAPSCLSRNESVFRAEVVVAAR